MKNNILAVSILVLFGCAGNSSDPLAKYPGLKSAEPSDQTIETQTVAQADLFNLEVAGTNEVNQAQFIEGTSSQTLLHVSVKDLKISGYSIEMIDFSSIDRPTLTPTNQSDVYALTWTPPTGLIAAGQFGKSFTAKFLITATNAENKLLVGVTNTAEIRVVVTRNSVQPIISGRSDLKSGVDEGQRTAFTVDVIDAAAASSPRLPEMQITPYISSNTEAYRANVSQYLFLDDKKENNPEKLGAHSYRFYYLLDIDRLPLDRDRLGHEIPVSTSVDICFLMRAISATGTVSEQVQVCSTARYMAQPPQFTFNQAELDAVKSGQENTINFSVQAAHPLSLISIKDAPTQIANLTGPKSITCDYQAPDKKNSLVCNLKWTPVCQKVNVTKNLTIKADNQVGEQKKSVTETRTLTITPNPDVCNAVKQGAQK